MYLSVIRVIPTLLTSVIMVMTLITFIWIHSVSLPVRPRHCSTQVFRSSSSAGTTAAPPAFPTHPNFPTQRQISSHRFAIQVPQSYSLEHSGHRSNSMQRWNGGLTSVPTPTLPFSIKNSVTWWMPGSGLYFATDVSAISQGSASRLSPMGVVPQCDCRPHPIVDYTFSGVNGHTISLAPDSMQFGRAFERLLQKLHQADTRHGPSTCLR